MTRLFDGGSAFGPNNSGALGSSGTDEARGYHSSANDPASGPSDVETLGESGLSHLQAAEVQSASRAFFLELVGNLVVCFVSVLVCLQVFASAQVTLDKSRAMSELGIVSMNLVENWKSGCELDELSQHFGGSVQDNSLEMLFDRNFQLTDNRNAARYIMVFTVQAGQGGPDTATVELFFGDEVLYTWAAGRNVPVTKEGQ
ncbi:MAG: hypothetical protein FWH40_00875 [Coriobacteriia bacterium]|nr:hypothetical protein [Coriobacteriia bacterium]